MQMERRSFFKTVVFACPGFAATRAAVASSGRRAPAATRRPNLVVIVSDDQGWGDVGYHDPEIRSPNLDRLARQGVELDCHYVQPECTPTRVALTTGRYPSRFGSHCTQASNDRAYPRGTLTMASMLKSLGYETAIVGKWHMGSKPEWGPNHYGFQYSYGSLAGAVGMYDHRYRLNSPYVTTWHRNLEFIEEEGHSTDLIAREAVAWIERKRHKPFFLYVPFHAVHTPLVERDAKWHEMNAHIENKDRRLFAAALSHMDWAVGEIVQALERTEQRDSTLIIFTSDNGAFAEPYRGGNYPAPDPALDAGFSSNHPLHGRKAEVYEGGIRVPAFVNWPGALQPRKIATPMHVVDWMPTLAALLGHEPPADPQWDGQNMWPILTGQRQSTDVRTFYWVRGESREHVALRHGDWKILKNQRNKPWELYNLSNDPCETHNLAESMPKKIEALKVLFEKERAKDAHVSRSPSSEQPGF